MTDVRKSYAECAGGYTELDTDSLAELYCADVDAGEIEEANHVFAAIVLKFWYRIGQMLTMCKTVPDFDVDLAADRLADNIRIVLEKRAWKDKSGITPQQCFNEMINRRSGRAVLYESNLKKNMVNSSAVSLDAPAPNGDSDDREMTLLDTLEEASGEFESDASMLAVKSYIQGYVNRGELSQAIILDCIACNPEVINTTTGSYTTASGNKEHAVYTKFVAGNCLNILEALPDDYSKYFAEKYRLSEATAEVAVKNIRAAGRSKLSRYLHATLLAARKDF